MYMISEIKNTHTDGESAVRNTVILLVLPPLFFWWLNGPGRSRLRGSFGFLEKRKVEIGFATLLLRIF